MYGNQTNPLVNTLGIYQYTTVFIENLKTPNSPMACHMTFDPLRP